MPLYLFQKLQELLPIRRVVDFKIGDLLVEQPKIVVGNFAFLLQNLEQKTKHRDARRISGDRVADLWILFWNFGWISIG